GSGAAGELGGVLAAGTTVAPQVPVRAPVANLLRGEPLVVAVVPLHQLVALERLETGEPRRLGRAEERAAPDGGEAPAPERPAQRERLGPTGVVERQVGATGVLAAVRPVG